MPLAHLIDQHKGLAAHVEALLLASLDARPLAL
jgi:hypothetical protein